MSLERKELLVKLLISRRLSFSYQNPVRRIPGVSYPPPGPLAFNYTWVFFLPPFKVCFFSIFKVLGDLIHYLLFFFVVLHSPSPTAHSHSSTLSPGEAILPSKAFLPWCSYCSTHRVSGCLYGSRAAHQWLSIPLKERTHPQPSLSSRVPEPE